MFTQQELAHTRKINNMLCRGKVNKVTVGNTATAQVDLMYGEVQNNLEMPENWGFISSPPPGAECVVAFFGGNRDHGTILKIFDKATAPKTLNPGESMMYNKVTGTKILLDKDGKISITSGSSAQYYITLSASGVLTMNVSEWWINGYRLV